MFGSEILDVALGMIFIFLLLSLVASGIREAFEAFVKSRAIFLERGIREMLGDKSGKGLACLLYNHPHISSLFKDGYQPKLIRRKGGAMPTYMPARSFATALIDIVIRGPVVDKHDDAKAADQDTSALSGDAKVFMQPATRESTARANTTRLTVDELRAKIDNLASERLKRVLVMAMDDAGDDLAKVQSNIETWFNETMDRVSGWYRRRTQAWLFVTAAVLVGFLNIDSVELTNHLWRSKSVREQLAARAEAVSNNPALLMNIGDDSTAQTATLKGQLAEFRALELPIGWDRPVGSPFVKFFGLIITMFAITLGASFWFDALKRVMVVRSTIKPSGAATAVGNPVPSPGAARLDVSIEKKEASGGEVLQGAAGN